MSEVNNVNNAQNTRFQRDTKVDYSKGSNENFRFWDINGDGVFNDKEWDLYSQWCQNCDIRESKIAQLKDKGVYEHYQREIDIINQELEKYYQQLRELPNLFPEIFAFEEKYGLVRDAVSEGEELPEGATPLDVTAFEMGERDKDGKIVKNYTKGYILGFENLTPELQQEYLQLVQKYSEIQREHRSLMVEVDKLETKLDGKLAMCDMVQNGQILEVLPVDKENEAVQRYLVMKDLSNPHRERINELQMLINKLSSKPNRTEAENLQLEQYYNEMRALNVVSSSILSDGQSQHNSGQGFIITDFSEQFRYQNGENNNELFTNSHSIGATWSNSHFNLTANVNNSQVYADHQDTQNNWNTMFMGTYQTGKFSTNWTSNMMIEGATTSYMNNLGVNYDKVGLEYEHQSSSTDFEMSDDFGNPIEIHNESSSDRIQANWRTGNFTNYVGVTFDDSGTSWTAGSRANFNISPTAGLNLSLTPNAQVVYNIQNETFTPQASIQGMAMYRDNDFSVNANLNNTFYTTIKDGVKPVNFNNFNFATTVGYKSIGIVADLTDMDMQFQHSTELGIGAYVQSQDLGKLQIRYAWQDVNQKMPGAQDYNSQIITASYSLPIDKINGWINGK